MLWKFFRKFAKSRQRQGSDPDQARLKGPGDVLHQKFVLVSSTKFALMYDNRERKTSKH